MIPSEATQTPAPAPLIETADDRHPPTADGKPLQVLLVKDSAEESDLLLRALGRGGVDPVCKRVETAESLRAALAAGPWDCVISDYTLPGFGASAALAIVRGADPDVPFIVISGAVGENAAVELMRLSASDYILKHDLTRLAPTVEREVREAGNRRARRTADRAAAFLAAVIESSDDAIVTKTLDGIIKTWNPAAEQLYGWTAGEAIGRDVSFLIPPEKLEEWFAYMHKLRAASRVGYFETVRLHRDGQRIDVALTMSCVRDSEGRVVGVSKTSRDIRDRKRAQEALQAIAERYQTLVAATAAIVWDTPPSGEFDTDQMGWTTFTGQTLQQHRGLGWLDAVHPDDREKTDRAWAAAMKERTVYQVEHRLRRADGVYRDMAVRAVPIFNRDRKIREWVGVHTDVTEQKKAESDLRMRDRAIQAATQGLMITDPNQPDCPIIYASPACTVLTGYNSQEVLGRNCRFLQGKDTDPAAVAQLREAIRAGKPCTVELLNYRKDGTPFWNELSIAPVRDEAGRLMHFIGVQADVTARRHLQSQFHQAQKMEAFGQLAGGISHDFNNLLCIINGYSEILLSTALDNSAQEMVAEILKAGQRSASLTRQLLVFSRKQVLLPRVFDLNETVRESEKLFRRLIGEDIELHTVSHARLDLINADPGQIEQVLMNLVVNARDAMPQGGKLTIETRNIELTEDYTREHPEVKPGNYVMLSVSDMGTGMTEETRRRLFEPFFTTKEIGKGTGLGLAVVQSIVKQSDGHIEVYSEPGLGTSFKIYLPRALKSQVATKSKLLHRTSPRGTETILLVEDEEAMRVLTMRTLRLCGYVVFDAANGNEALRFAGKSAEPIHLLVTDVVMPGMGGRKLADQLAPLHANMKVLYISGYTDDAVIRHGILHDDVNFLQKPFSAIALAVKVREVLDAPVANRA